MRPASSADTLQDVVGSPIFRDPVIASEASRGRVYSLLRCTDMMSVHRSSESWDVRVGEAS